jgi:hypothetical protein
MTEEPDERVASNGEDDYEAEYFGFLDEIEGSEPADATFEIGPDSLGGASQVRSRDEALDGGLPLLMLHREASYFKRLPDVIAGIRGSHAASLSTAAVVNLPRLKPGVAETWLTSSYGASVLIADPEVYSRDDMWGVALHEEREGPPRPTGEPRRPLMPKTAALWPYWNRPLDVGGPNRDWVREVLDAQREAGANLLLTPGTPLNEHDPVPSLHGVEQQVAWVREQLSGDERLAVNITMDGAWLASGALRAHLLNAIVESDENTWYIRVKWPFAPAYSQLADTAIIDGYRELSTVMEDQERVLLLPNSGGTGWISLAWGATGFGTGMGNVARGFTTGRVIRRKAPVPPIPPRYFERALLHTVEVTTSDALARIPGYRPCSCLYCSQLRAAQTWDSELSGAHYLLAIADQTAALAGGPNRRGMARRAVRAAIQTRDEVVRTVPLTDRDAPVHLPIWESRLL